MTCIQTYSPACPGYCTECTAILKHNFFSSNSYKTDFFFFHNFTFTAKIDTASIVISNLQNNYYNLLTHKQTNLKIVLVAYLTPMAILEI